MIVGQENDPHMPARRHEMEFHQLGRPSSESTALKSSLLLVKEKWEFILSRMRQREEELLDRISIKIDEVESLRDGVSLLDLPATLSLFEAESRSSPSSG